MNNILGKKIMMDTGKKIANLALKNGPALAKKVMEVAPVGVVIGVGVGALAILGMAANDLSSDDDIIVEDAI